MQSLQPGENTASTKPCLFSCRERKDLVVKMELMEVEAPSAPLVPLVSPEYQDPREIAVRLEISENLDTLEKLELPYVLVYCMPYSWKYLIWRFAQGMNNWHFYLHLTVQ